MDGLVDNDNDRMISGAHEGGVATTARPVPRPPRSSRVESCALIVPGWRVTPHARDAIARREFDLEAVVEALLRPDSLCAGLEPGTEERRRGHVLVVVNPQEKVIITVLLNRSSRWSDHDARRVNNKRGW